MPETGCLTAILYLLAASFIFLWEMGKRVWQAITRR